MHTREISLVPWVLVLLDCLLSPEEEEEGAVGPDSTY